jgi:hypothetical protein
MKPYFEVGGISIYHGDSREILPALGKFDLLLTDPPSDKMMYQLRHCKTDGARRLLLGVKNDINSEGS